MAFPPPFALDDLDPNEVSLQRQTAIQRFREAAPSVDVESGAVRALVLDPLATVLAARDRQLQAYLDARSPLAVTQAEVQQTDPAAVDHLLSNHRIERRPGQTATGSVRVRVDRSATVVIASGSVFVAGARRYQALGAFVAKREPAQVREGTGDRLLEPEGEGRYSFTIDVAATEAADGTALRRGSPVTPLQPPAGFLSATAASDFSAGFAPETDRQALARLRVAVTPAAPGTQDGFDALMAAHNALQTAVRGSAVGHGDPEMSRDAHPVTGLRQGGRVDWYLRGALLPHRRTLTLTATRGVASPTGGYRWAVSLPPDQVAGLYEAVSVTRGGVAATDLAHTRGVQTLDGGPVIHTAAQAAFSAYQTVSLSFTAAGTPAEATAAFEVTLRYMPLIREAQDLLNTSSTRPAFGDVLVRGPVPCGVSVALVLTAEAGSEAAPVDALREAAALAINQTPFGQDAAASAVQQAVWPLLPAGTRVRDVQLVGRVLFPTGEVRYTADPRGDRVALPASWAAEGVSLRTTQFFADTDDIGVTTDTP